MEILQKIVSLDAYDIYQSNIDTKYFGIPSGKVVLKQPCADKDQQDTLLDCLRDFTFVMIANKGSNPVNNHWLGERTSAFLVDINIQLRKELSNPHAQEDCSANGCATTIADAVAEDPEIVHIAETYFTYSQFLNDPYLDKEKARCIYGDIVKNAFGKPGRLFVLTKIADVMAGFLLFGMNTELSTSTIQLIAVNPNFTRQRIGQSLVRSMENYVFSQGIRKVIVGTQFNNFGALKFYHTVGFTQTECSTLYHYWPGKNKPI